VPVEVGGDAGHLLSRAFEACPGGLGEARVEAVIREEGGKTDRERCDADERDGKPGAQAEGAGDPHRFASR
jgi:hypothetical protein